MTMLRRRLPIVLLLALVAVSTVSSSFAADWPRWRGIHRDGTSVETDIFPESEFGLEVIWSRPLGKGYSGIALRGGRAVTMFTDGKSDFLVALDAATGEEIWRYAIAEMYKGHDGSDDGPIGMPQIDGGTVYGLGPRGQLFSVRLSDGEEIWSKNIADDFEARSPFYGFSTMPMIAGDVLFVQTGAADGKSFVGLDKHTGDLLWSAADSEVGYQSPTLARLAGSRQIVAVGNKEIVGLAPDSGEVLWTHEYNPEGEEGSEQPLVLGDDTILLNGQTESVILRVTSDDSGFAVEEVRHTEALKGSFAAPVLHEGHLYGFSGDFLTCVDAASGEKVWKSRPPGGRGLILVEGHLIILAPNGEVVVVEASAEGYKEKARVPVSDHGGYTWPSFADDWIFVRNQKDIAAVGVTATPARAEAEDLEPPSNAFEAFVRVVSQSDRKRLLVDEFMNAQGRFPVIEDGTLVHFVYRGEVDDIAITGSMTEFRAEEPLKRIEGTDLYYRTYEIAPGARWEYQFNVDFETLGPDPLNPRRVPGFEADNSEVLTPGRAVPDHVRPYTGSTPGRLETFKFESQTLGNDRDVTVYLPAGYDDGSDSYRLMIVNQGEGWLEKANLPNSLDNLIGVSVSPVIVAFVPTIPESERDELGGEKSTAYVEMLADELLPHLDRTYRTVADRSGRTVMGLARGGLLAASAALSRPEVFGNAAVHSVYLTDKVGESVISTPAEAREPRAKFWIGWNRYELRRAEWSFDLAVDSRKLAEALKDNGFTVAGGEALDGAGWGSWRSRAGEMLEFLYPFAGP